MKRFLFSIIILSLFSMSLFGQETYDEDENTYDDTAPEDKVELVSLNTFIVPGDMKIDDANEILGLSLESDEMNTVGGWLLEQLGYLPASGTVFIKDRNLFTAEDVSGRRIVSVRVKKSS